MKPVRPETYQIIPLGTGWRLAAADSDAQTADTLEQAAQFLPNGTRVELFLPTHLLILERMKLPASDAGELAGMVELQLEKSLSFPINEVASSFLLVQQGEKSSSVLSIAVRLSQLDELCAPFRSRGILTAIRVHAADIAADLPPQENALCIFEEDGQIVATISAYSKLAWAHCTSVSKAGNFADELTGLSLAAEMDGASTEFDRIYLDRAHGPWQEALKNHFSTPIAILPLDGRTADSGVDLTPKGWLNDAANEVKSARRKRLLLLVAAAYLAAVAGGFAYIGWLKMEANKLDAENAVIRPRIEALQASQARWKAMEPALDPDRATVELLYQLCRHIPKDKLHLTEFDQSVTQWKVFGESDSADLAVEYLSALKNEKDLAAFRISSSPPSLLPNGSAQFSIFGKR